MQVLCLRNLFAHFTYKILNLQRNNICSRVNNTHVSWGPHERTLEINFQGSVSKLELPEL